MISGDAAQIATMRTIKGQARLLAALIWAFIAATVTKTRRFGTLANMSARRRLAPVRFRHWSDRLS